MNNYCTMIATTPSTAATTTTSMILLLVRVGMWRGISLLIAMIHSASLFHNRLVLTLPLFTRIYTTLCHNNTWSRWVSSVDNDVVRAHLAIDRVLIVVSELLGTTFFPSPTALALRRLRTYLSSRQLCLLLRWDLCLLIFIVIVIAAAVSGHHEIVQSLISEA